MANKKPVINNRWNKKTAKEAQEKSLAVRRENRTARQILSDKLRNAVKSGDRALIDKVMDVVIEEVLVNHNPKFADILFKLTGDYAPEKVAQTDTKGNDVQKIVVSVQPVKVEDNDSDGEH